MSKAILAFKKGLLPNSLNDEKYFNIKMMQSLNLKWKNIITNMDYKKLINKARKLRQDTFLAFIKKGEAHLGGSFSMIEILLTLYEVIMKKDDKFILSKAHASFPLCLLLEEKGLKPQLTTHLEIDKKNGIHCTTGS